MSLLETKAAGRSPEFDGDAKHWEEWNFKFVTWIGLLGNPGEGSRIQQQLDEIARDPEIVTPLLDVGENTGARGLPIRIGEGRVGLTSKRRHGVGG